VLGDLLLFGFWKLKASLEPAHVFVSNYYLDQILWAQEFLCALDEIDTRQILTIILFYPSKTDGSSEGRKTRFKPPKQRMLSVPGTLDVEWLIEKEWGAEAGNMLVAGQSLSRIHGLE
jgi:hypothetical protein